MSVLPTVYSPWCPRECVYSQASVMQNRLERAAGRRNRQSLGGHQLAQQLARLGWEMADWTPTRTRPSA
jgi:hypothetical protein